MPNLNPTPGWDNVPELPTTTQALGGPGGPMNLQAQALMNRTEALNPDNQEAPASLDGTETWAFKKTGEWALAGLAAIASYIIKVFTGFIQAGTGAVARTVQAKLREVVDGADFGVTADGTTNDTAALNLAIAYCNTLVNGQYKVLRLPPGTCLVTPGALTPILCDIDAPRTTLKAASNALANLLTIGYTNALVEGQVINLYALTGFNFNYGGTDTRYGYGLGFSAAAGQYIGQLKVNIFFVQGFIRSINGDISDGFHVGTNIFNINTLWYSTYGIYSKSGNLEWENNVFNITYQTFCAFNVYSESVGTAHNVQNTYHIHCLELHTLANTNGFNLVGANTNNNLFIVDAIYYNANTQWIAVSDNLSTRNEFRLPGADLAKIPAAGNIFRIDGFGNLNDVSAGRSVVHGASPPPASGPWSTGDRYIVNNPAAGSPSSYRYITGTGWVPDSVSGNGTYTPTATLGANAAAATPYAAYWTRNGNVVTVHGSIDITATAANTATALDLTLPVPSNLTASTQLSGTFGGIFGNAMSMGHINGNASTDKASFHLAPSTTSATNYQFSFSYIVL
ncbi:hypothetical protein [Bradyrhizobium sp. BWC-3-1]|uniref:hypothetical protein n=1 Tax=Bradyrhizobium sp. BWC-3-1 TaxID=3080012 RepID=UPI00293EEE8D|nr:hypothetical protein [Bradyrhizobium sp. BWC-3-1]WOH61902.1 hypothetical protein RX329_18145 [Bradyrhizobium sp. BWC-3-1]